MSEFVGWDPEQQINLFLASMQLDKDAAGRFIKSALAEDEEPKGTESLFNAF